MFKKIAKWLEIRKKHKQPPIVFNNELNSDIAFEGYPFIRKSHDPKIKGFSFMLLVTEDSYDQLIGIANNVGFKYTRDKNHELLSSTDSAHSLFVTTWKDFHGTVVHMLTSSTALIKDIQKAKLHPPRPEVSFSDISPEEFGSLQGNIDFWWHTFWKIFWHSLTEEEQQKLNLSEGWLEFIEFH